MDVKQNKDLRIEFLRVFAILLTLFSHISVINPDYEEITTTRYFGGGVFLFFVIAGFLITNSFINFYNLSHKFKYIKIYLIKRIFRLLPSAFIVSTVTYIVAKFFGISYLNSYIFSILNIQNLHIYHCVRSVVECSVDPLWHYWSLSAEEQFFLIAPFF